MLEHIRQQLWKQIILPIKAWQKKCDIVYCNDYFVPFIHLNYQTVMLFHDALFFEHPEYSNRIWLKLFKHIALPAAKRAAFIITPTHFAKERVQHFTGIAAEKIIPIYHGPKTMALATNAEPIPDWLPTQKGFQYILHVGVMEKRKNLPRLVQAYKLLKDAGYTQYKLVLAGKGNGKINSDDTEQIFTLIKENQLENDVILPGYLPDNMLPLLYNNATLYVFPSVNEGFGIPILEAFGAGLPVVVANNTCLPEVGGDAVLTFDPYTVTDIAEKIKQVLDNDSLRESLISKGKERLQSFSWGKSSTNLIKVFEQAVINKKKE
jgi:glycosyltransferase involved in cell wall biosynthesis